MKPEHDEICHDDTSEGRGTCGDEPAGRTTAGTHRKLPVSPQVTAPLDRDGAESRRPRTGSDATMETAPTNAPVEDVDTDDDDPTWTDFVAAVVCLAIAVVPFTPLWDEFSNPEEVSRRYRGVARLLDTVGPVPVSLVFAVIGVVLLLVAVNKVRNARNA